MKAASVLAKNRLPAKAIEYFNNPDTPNAEYKLIRGLFTDAELKSLGWRHPESFDKLRTGSVEGHPFSHSELVEESVIASGAKQNLAPLQLVSFLESTFYMRNQLLRDSDVFSMAHSMELRVPFVDHLLYGTVLPYLDDGFDKNFSKKMLVEGTSDLPDDIVHRPKQGFTFPFANWMRSGKIKDSINDSLMSSNSLFDKTELNEMMNKFNSGKLHWSRIWAMNVISRF